MASLNERQLPLIEALESATTLSAFEQSVVAAFHLDPAEPAWEQLDSVQRALLVRLVSYRRPDVTLDLLQAASSVADVYAWALADHASATPHSDSADSTLSSGLVHIREWRDEDLPRLYRAATSPEHGRNWRLRGATPSFQQFASTLGTGSLATLVVATNPDDVAVGTVSAYSPSLENGWVYIGFQGVDARSGIGLMLEGMFLFVTWLFDTWNLRKVYAEVSPGLMEELRSLEPNPLAVEGRLTEHVFDRGLWEDVLILSIRREPWVSFVSSMSELVRFQAAAPGQ